MIIKSGKSFPVTSSVTDKSSIHANRMCDGESQKKKVPYSCAIFELSPWVGFCSVLTGSLEIPTCNLQQISTERPESSFIL